MTQVQAAHEIIARNRRLGKEAKRRTIQLKAKRTVFVHVRPDANQHVMAWDWWQELRRSNVSPVDYIRLSCRILDIDPLLLFSHSRRRYLVVCRKMLVREVAAKYPSLSSPQLGRFFHRDHTTILYLLGRTQSAKQRGLV